MDIDVNSPGGGTVDDYDWSEVDEFQLSNIGEKERWIKWFGLWREVYIDEGDDHLGFILDLVSKGTEEPIVVVRWRDGKFYIWDGNHRIAASFVLGLETIKAIVGTLR